VEISKGEYFVKIAETCVIAVMYKATKPLRVRLERWLIRYPPWFLAEEDTRL